MTCLIVANQTLGGAQLQWEVSNRIKAGRDRFHVLVPVIQPGLEASNLTVWHHAPSPSSPSSRAQARNQARERAQHRLERMIEVIKELGGTADGEVGTTNAVGSVQACLHHGAYDEILISTLPSGVSHWLKADLPARVAHVTDIPVATVEHRG